MTLVYGGIELERCRQEAPIELPPNIEVGEKWGFAVEARRAGESG